MNLFCFIKEKFYVPESILDMDAVHDRYIHPMYDDNMCNSCQYRNYRHSASCDPCEGYKGDIHTYRAIMYKGEKYIGLPLGDKKYFKNLLRVSHKDLTIEDRRYKPEFKYPVEFEGKLRVYQEPLVEDFLKARYGIIQAPPRTGKTICCLDTIIKLGKRALVIASQNEFLLQFEYHVRDYTNLPQLEKKYRRKLFGIAKKEEDFDNYQICMSTYQRFMSENGQKLLRRIAPGYGTVCIDECFPEGTKILIDEKTSVDIKVVYQSEDITSVLSFNLEKNTFEEKKILHKMKRKTNKLLQIELEDGSLITCTENHPFWSNTRNTWVKACDLMPDEDVRSWS